MSEQEEARAGSGHHLNELLTQHRRYVFSLTAGKRLDQVARDFVQHYSTAWQTGKAMLVCIDKITCVRMYKLIAFYWDERIRELEKALTKITNEQELIFLHRQIAWMRETRMAVVVSEEQGEMGKFREWELDITPHRRLMKEGIDLPDSMRSRPEYRNMQAVALDDAFKADEHPFRIAIVACKEAANENDESRKRLELMCRAVFKKFKACINVAAVNRYRADRDAINIVYKSLQQDREQADISGIIRQLHEVVDAAIAIEPNQREERASYDISKIDFGRLRQEFEYSAQKNTTVQSLRQAVERQLQKLLQQNPLRTDFQQHYEQIVAEYNREKDRLTIERSRAGSAKAS